MRLDNIMKPGRVGETFEIFTTPVSNWWGWKSTKQKEIEVLAFPDSPPRVHKIKGKKFSFAKVWERSSVVKRPADRNSGVKQEFDGSLRKLFGRTKILINGIWIRMFGV